MKLIITLPVCLLAISVANGQVKTTGTVTTTRTTVVKKNVVYGDIKTIRNKPIKGVQAFVYNKTDSSIIASGSTDDAGHYETNAIPDGEYYMKIVYPSRKIAIVEGVVIKNGARELDIKIQEPEADTILGYTLLMPKPEPKKLAGKK